MEIKYLAIIEKEDNTDYSVIFPDFPGCITAGETLNETKGMALEVLHLHVRGMFEDNQILPLPSTIEKIMKEYPSATFFMNISIKL